jgi:hypothetical protein
VLRSCSQPVAAVGGNDQDLGRARCPRVVGKPIETDRAHERSASLATHSR